MVSFIQCAFDLAPPHHIRTNTRLDGEVAATRIHDSTSAILARDRTGSMVLSRDRTTWPQVHLRTIDYTIDRQPGLYDGRLSRLDLYFYDGVMDLVSGTEILTRPPVKKEAWEQEESPPIATLWNAATGTKCSFGVVDTKNVYYRACLTSEDRPGIYLLYEGNMELYRILHVYNHSGILVKRYRIEAGPGIDTGQGYVSDGVLYLVTFRRYSPTVDCIWQIQLVSENVKV
jgi:hypothetical protein